MPNSRPLLLMTRPEASSRAFLKALPQAARDSVEILINPLLEIQVTGPLPDLEGIRGLIFTSANALDAYHALGGHGLDMPVFAVGEGTASMAKALGFQVDMAGGNSDRLVQHILDRGPAGPLMHLRGETAIGDVAQRLTVAGVPTREAILYEQKLKPLRSEAKAALSQDRQVIAPVFSPRTARQLTNESEDTGFVWFGAISQSVADELPPEAAARTRIAAHPNRDGMVALVTDMIKYAVTLERSRRQL